MFKDWIPAFAGMTTLMLLAGPAFAANKNVGTSGGQFLKIGAGARPTALGEAFVGLADDANAVYHNPAGLGQLERIELTAMHTQYFQGLDYNFGAYVHPLKSGAFAFSAATLATDTLTRRGVDESSQGTFENLDAAYALSYGHRFQSKWFVGITARLIQEKIDTASAQAWSGDVGVLKRFEGPLSLGLAIRHFGQEVKFNEEGDPLPLTIDGGICYRLMNDRLKLLTDIRQVRDTGVQFGLGTEWTQALSEKYRYALRLGYNSAVTDAEGATGISIGAGFGIRQFELDFGWVPFGDLGNTFRYAINMKF